MSLRNRIILFNLFLTFFTLGCLKTFPVLEDPPPGEEGLVAFGLIVSQGGLSNGIFIGIANPASRETKISSVADPTLGINLYDSGKDMEGDGNYRFRWVQKLRLGANDSDTAPHFVVTRLPPNKPLFISSTSYTYITISHYNVVDKYGRVQTYTSKVPITISIPIEYDQSDKQKFAFFNPGGLRIRFLGNFIAHPPEPNMSYNNKYEGKYVLTNLTEHLQKNPSANGTLKSKFYGEEEISETGAEIHFLKRFIVENRSRYWEGIAIRRLLEVDSETREKVQKAKIAIPKEDLPIGSLSDR